MSATAFSRYVASKAKKSMEEQAYRDYTCEALRLLTHSNAEITGKGSYLTVKYNDLIHPKPEDTRTGDEIKADILGKLRGGK